MLGREPSAAAAREEVARRYRLVGAALLAYAFLPLALGALSRLGWEGWALLTGGDAFAAPGPIWQGVADLLAAALAGLLPFWWLRRQLALPPVWRPTEPRPAGLWRAFPLRCLVLLGINTLATGAVDALAGWLRAQGLSPQSPDFSLAGGGAPAALLLATVALVAPVVEEYAFRGVLLRALAPSGRRFAVAVSALLFALAHGNLRQGLPALAMGLYLGYLADRAGTPRYTAALHLVNNAVALVLPYLGEGGSLVYLLLTAGAAVTAAALHVGQLFCREAAPLQNDPALPREWRWRALLTSPPVLLAGGYYLLCIALSCLP